MNKKSLLCMLAIISIFTTASGKIDKISPYSIPLSYMNINNAGATISKPGNYFLTGNVSFYPVNNPSSSTIIHITKSNVSLNLNNCFITQAANNDKLNLNGIVIDPNLHDVSIINGTITGISGIGIIVGSGCKNIIIDDMEVTDCVQGGITAIGTENAPVISLTIKNTTVGRNNGDPSVYGDTINSYSPLGIQLIYTNAFTLRSCHAIAHQTTTNDPAYGVYLENCNAGTLHNSIFSLQKSNDKAYGVFAQKCSLLEFVDCQFLKNSSLMYSAFGCALIGCSNNKLTQCQAIGNNGNSVTYGFYLQGLEETDGSQITYYGSDYNSMIECVSQGNITTLGDCYGFFSTGNTTNNFSQSLAKGNLSGTQSSSLCAGFYAQQLNDYTTSYDETLITIQQCKSKANCARDDNGTGAGILLNTVYKGHIEENWSLNNTGALYSYGIADFTPASDTLIMSNYAFGHITNYLATYEDPNARIPVISGTVGDFSTMANSTPFINYEWRNNCNCYNED